MSDNTKHEKYKRLDDYFPKKVKFLFRSSRTAASRDPGSVSEAESDEENEEGDYTVYECPGLASVSL